MRQTSPALTPRQFAVIDFIRFTIKTVGVPPTVREIGSQLSIKSPNGVMCHLKALERKGLIDRMPYKSRGIRLVGVEINLPPLPCLGEVA